MITLIKKITTITVLGLGFIANSLYGNETETFLNEVEQFKKENSIRSIDVIVGSKHTSRAQKMNDGTRYKYNEANPGVSITMENGITFGCAENSFENLSCHGGYEKEFYRNSEVIISGKAILATGYYDKGRREMTGVSDIAEHIPGHLLPAAALTITHKESKVKAGIFFKDNPTFVFSYSF